jgi:hypothetical protein
VQSSDKPLITGGLVVFRKRHLWDALLAHVTHFNNFSNFSNSRMVGLQFLPRVASAA